MAETGTYTHDAHKRAFLTATIIANPVIHEAPGEGRVSEMQVDWPGPEPLPGQFFMLRLQRSAVLLGRPISVLDSTRGMVSFLIAERGRGSRELVHALPGERLELTGPLGNTWPGATGLASVGPIPGESAPGKPATDEPFLPASAALPQKPLALVGGGIGIAPLIFLSRTLPAGSYYFYAGFRSRPYGLERLPPGQLTIATEDGSAGHRGLIPDFFTPADYRAVYACGPTPMLRRLAEDCGKANVPCYISMEERMACGVGACLGCTVRTIRGNRRCCADGPIFPAEEVFFDT